MKTLTDAEKLDAIRDYVEGLRIWGDTTTRNIAHDILYIINGERT